MSNAPKKILFCFIHWHFFFYVSVFCCSRKRFLFYTNGLFVFKITEDGVNTNTLLTIDKFWVFYVLCCWYWIIIEYRSKYVLTLKRVIIYWWAQQIQYTATVYRLWQIMPAPHTRIHPPRGHRAQNSETALLGCMKLVELCMDVDEGLYTVTQEISGYGCRLYFFKYVHNMIIM